MENANWVYDFGWQFMWHVAPAVGIGALCLGAFFFVRKLKGGVDRF